MSRIGRGFEFKFFVFIYWNLDIFSEGLYFNNVGILEWYKLNILLYCVGKRYS